MLIIDEIVKSTGGRLISSCSEHKIDKIVIDSREACEGALFIALIGERVDGHNYIKSAYELGCRTFLVNKNAGIYMSESVNIIEVEDTEIALGDIAKCYKEKFEALFIAITGSVGKTTTRDMIYAVVSEKYNTLRNEKNYNNQIGVPLTLMNLDKVHECAVIEMGMCGFNEIEYLANIVNPKIGVISNIGQSHIERLGSREGIFKAKLEIATNFNEHNLLIVNGDDDFLRRLKAEETSYRVMTFGYDEENDVYCKEDCITEDRSEFVCSIDGLEEKFIIPTAGKHNIYNAMSAICVGMAIGMSISEIRQGLKNFKPTGMRQAIVGNEKVTIINDAYNASPDSMKAALGVLGRYDRRRIAILGDIFEMGEFIEEGMRSVGREVNDNVDLLITVGDNSRYIGDEARNSGFLNIKHYSAKELIEIDKIIKTGDVVLVKGSRGMGLEYVVDKIEERSKTL